MKRYATAYATWLIGVAAMALIALEWYRHVENIGWKEVGQRLRGNYDAPDESPDETDGDGVVQ